VLCTVALSVVAVSGMLLGAVCVKPGCSAYGGLCAVLAAPLQGLRLGGNRQGCVHGRQRE
jgi:hypothetical protein